MNIRQFTGLLFSLLVFINCEEPEVIEEVTESEQVEEPNEEEEDTEELEEKEDLEKITYFTLNVNANYDTYNGSNFFLIYSETGDLIDYKSYTNNSTHVFESEQSIESDKLMVTNVRIYEYNGNQYATLQTYEDISKNSEWFFIEKPNIELNEPLGNFEFVINTNPGIQSLIVSNNYDFHVFHRPNNAPNTSTAPFNNSVYEYQPYLISSLDKNDEWKYVFIDQIKKDSVVSIDYDKFRAYDHETIIPVPQEFNRISYGVTAYDNLDATRFAPVVGYKLCQRTLSGEDEALDPFKLVYLDTFKKFKSTININYNDYSFSHWKTGSKLTNINIPIRPSFRILDKSINSFDFETNVAHESKRIDWSLPIEDYTAPFFYVLWGFNSIEDSNISPALPEEILNLLPDNILERLEYSGTSLHMAPNFYHDNLIRNFEQATYTFLDDESINLHISPDFQNQ